MITITELNETSSLRIERMVVIMAKFEELLDAVKAGELLKTKEDRDKDKHRRCICTVLAIIGAIAVVAGIAYAVYRYLTPNYLDDFDDDFDDDFEDDDMDEEEKPEEEKPEKEEAKSGNQEAEPEE